MTFYKIVTLTEDVRCLNFCLSEKGTTGCLSELWGRGQSGGPQRSRDSRSVRADRCWRAVSEASLCSHELPHLQACVLALCSRTWQRHLDGPCTGDASGARRGQAGPCTASPPKRSRRWHEVASVTGSRAPQGPCGGAPAGLSTGRVRSESHETQRRTSSAVCVGGRGAASSF